MRQGVDKGFPRIEFIPVLPTVCPPAIFPRLYGTHANPTWREGRTVGGESRDCRCPAPPLRLGNVARGGRGEFDHLAPGPAAAGTSHTAPTGRSGLPGTARERELVHASRRRLISVVAMSVTLLAGSATASVALATENPAAAPAATVAPTAPVENLIVGYKSSATEASSNTAAADDAAAKGKKAGKKAKFDRRLGTGAALVNLGGPWPRPPRPT